MIEEVKSPSTVDFESFSQESQPEAAETVVSDASNEDEIREKSLVYLVGSPDVRGIVMSITDLGDTKKYDVFVDGNFKTFYSGQIALYVETASYNWVDINTFRSCPPVPDPSHRYKVQCSGWKTPCTPRCPQRSYPNLEIKSR